MAKAKAFIQRHPAWITVIIVLLAGVFMGAKWLDPVRGPAVATQFATAELGDLRVTVTEGGALDSTSKLNLRCELAGGGTIVELVNEGTYVKGPRQHQVTAGDTLQKIAGNYSALAQAPGTLEKPIPLQIVALEEAIQRANPEVDWAALTPGETLELPGDLLVKFEDDITTITNVRIVSSL